MNTENTDLEASGPDEVLPPVPPPASKKKSAEADDPLYGDLPASEPPRRKGGFLSFLAFVFAALALALSAWMWWQSQSEAGLQEARVFEEISRLESSDSEMSLKLKQLRDDVSLLTEGDISGEFASLQQRLENDLAALGQLEQSLQEQQSLSRALQAATASMQGRMQAAEAAVSNLSTRELDAGGELDLAEVDYLLRLANERLKLFTDPAAADEALEVADMHLAALDNPMYLGVRQDIARVRNELAALELPDYLEIAGRLDAVQMALSELSFELNEQAAAADPESPEGDGWWDKTKRVFASLVTVRRSTDEENQRISLQDRDMVRQRIWLQLEVAHLALMRRDQDAFRSSLQRARDTMAGWFVRDDAFEAADADVEALQVVEIEVDVPDITAPWNTLRLLRSTQGAAQPLRLDDSAGSEDETGDEASPAGDEGETEEPAEDPA